MLSRYSPFVTARQGAKARMVVPVSTDGDTLVDTVAFADVVAVAEVLKVPLGYMRHADWEGAWRPMPPDGALSALVRVEGGTVRWRDDGVEPDVLNGMPMYDGDPLQYDLTTQSLWFFPVDGAAVLHVSFYGAPYETEGA